MRIYALTIIFFSFSITCSASDNEQLFDSRLIQNIIENSITLDKVLVFDNKCKEELNIYGGLYLWPTNYFIYYIDYYDYNILVVTSQENNIVHDYIILKKETEKSHFYDGVIEIDDKHFDWIAIILFRDRWQGKFREDVSGDISNAYIINFETGKIEEIKFNTITIYSEI